jgi:3-methyl-2-oxobutanoate hydroxymethyltransferase
VAEIISDRVGIPTIGIGAGPHCDGQVLVIHDLIGLFDGFRPRFVKQYADIFSIIAEALNEYRQDVIDGAFPAPEHGYAMSDEALEALLTELDREL